MEVQGHVGVIWLTGWDGRPSSQQKPPVGGEAQPALGPSWHHRPGAASLQPSGLSPSQSRAVTSNYQRKPQTTAQNCPKSPKQ